MATLRERNRRATMRETQRAALRMFTDDGFDAVTVEEIAQSVGMAASTVYRHFGTKEAIVLWDEHDVALDSALGRNLGQQPPLHAIRDALIETLASRYDSDLQFQLSRITYIYATEQVHAAAVEADLQDRHELTGALERVLPRAHRAAAPVIAGAALVALDVALDRWQRQDAEQPLGDLIADAFATLAELETIT
ncbi:TetR/AcrR family transcriptional regulator [soil metagenome]